MRSKLLWLGLSLWSGVAVAADGGCTNAPSRIESEPFDFSAVAQLVRCQDIGSIDELLPRLPQTFRARHSLIYASGSRHGASRAIPRIVMASEDARMIIAVAGDSSQRNGNLLEAIQYNDSESQFEFHSIDFPQVASPGQRPQVSPKNPTLCASCHRAQFSPNWESYPLWPGAYGSGASAGRDEDTAYAGFAANAARQGRYRALGPFPADLLSTDLEGHNHALSQAIGSLNQERVVSGILVQPGYPKAQFAIAGSFLGCADLESFLPARARAHLSESYSAYHEKVRLQTLSHFNSQESRLASLTGDEFSRPSSDWLFFFEAEPVIGAAFFSRELMGFDLSRYAVSRDGSFFDSHHTLGGLRIDARLSAGSFGPEDCANLRQKSLEALSR